MKALVKHRIFKIALLLAVLFLMPALPAAGDTGNGEYTIKSGDTLWDISAEKLKSPFQWKSIWKLNPYIKNPDLIYPGNTLIIPGESAENEKGTETESEISGKLKRMIVPEKIPAQQVTVGKRDYLVSREVLINSGYIASTLPETAGSIYESPEKRTLMGRGDSLYIRMGGPAEAGKKFYILSAPEKVRNPATRDLVGYLVRIKGILEITGMEEGNKKARITESFEDILAGDPLTPYYTIDLPLEPVTETRPAAGGTIVKVYNDSNAIGKYGVVYLDKGTRDGIGIGDLFTAVTADTPSTPAGTLQVISAREKTSVAVVKRSGREIQPGDSFRN